MIKFYQAGTSEMFGSSPPPQSEKTRFSPKSPYAISKLYAHWITINYREAYNVFACNGILFNHESFFRGETFVTKKIVKSLCAMATNNKKEKLYLGNLYALRDWGHAKDYVEAIWKILQKKTPDDYVIATGKQYSVKQFVNFVANELNLKIKWKYKGLKEKGYINGVPKIFIDKNYLRPTEVDNLLGNFSKAKIKLNWKPKYDIFSLVSDMVSKELKHSEE
jgi:GDPmannose 4,6-dehydratase